MIFPHLFKHVGLLSILFVTTATSLVIVANAQDRQASQLQTLALPETDEGLPGAGPIRRYDWFRNLWLQRRSAWMKQRDGAQGSLVFLGDSITQGWGENLDERFGSRIANRGISGDTTRGMLLRLGDDVLALRPSGIVMLMGTNDIEEGADPATIVNNIQLIVERCYKHRDDLPIVLCLVFPSSPQMRRPPETIQSVNDGLRKAFKGNRQVTLLDTWTLFAGPDNNAKLEDMPDLLHLNEAGYKKWEKALVPILETLALVPVASEDFEPEAGFETLFNGDDLTGWGFQKTSLEDRQARANWLDRNPGAAEWPLVDEPIWFDGETQSDDGRFVARHNRIVVTTPSAGRRIQVLSTKKEFNQDFVLRLEFRATPNADSGIFIRGKQLQCRDYALAGPYKELANYRPQDWNAIEIRVTGTKAQCTCNGEVLEEAMEIPQAGPIGFEGDRGQVEYRRIRVQSF